GLRARLDEAGNVIGEAGDGGPTIMLLGPLDPVPGPPPGRPRGGTLRGPGAVGPKGPLGPPSWAPGRPAPGRAARLAGGGGVAVGAGVVGGGGGGEEGRSPGALHLLAGPVPDAVLIGEPSGVGAVVVGYRGIMRVRLDVVRPRVHTSNPTPRAVEVATAAWRTL